MGGKFTLLQYLVIMVTSDGKEHHIHLSAYGQLSAVAAARDLLGTWGYKNAHVPNETECIGIQRTGMKEGGA